MIFLKTAYRFIKRTMKAKEKRYSVIIVSGATSTKREFFISSKMIRNSILLFIAFLLFSAYFIFDYLNTSINKEKLKQLEKENIKKTGTLNQIGDTIRNKEKMLAQMAVFKDRILIVIGYDSPRPLTGLEDGGYSFSAESIPVVPVEVKVPGNDRRYEPTGKKLLKKTEGILDRAIKINGELKSVENFVENQKARFESTPYIWPTKGYITSTPGWRIHPLTGNRHYHQGLDIAAQYGTKVVATGRGVVLEAGHWDYLGNLVIIDHGFGYTTRYGHLASFVVKTGDRVKRNQVIGYVGNTGRSSAPHLHYEVRYNSKPVNPINFIID
jgi:murein DD-endopeptidase MepM/ murein hydrolase activator NlpD